MSNPTLSPTAAGTTLSCLNDALEHLMILPVQNLLNIPGGSDAFWVYQRMVRIHRTMQAQGWYCFNRLARFKPTYDVGTDRYTVPGAIMARTARRLPTDPCWPEVRLEFPAGVPTLVRTDRSEAHGQYAFTEAERNLLIDVTFARTIDEAPEQYRSFLAALTAEEMAAKFGSPVPQGMSQVYLDALKRLEADHEPRANVFEDEVNTLLTWAR